MLALFDEALFVAAVMTSDNHLRALREQLLSAPPPERRLRRTSKHPRLHRKTLRTSCGTHGPPLHAPPRARQPRQRARRHVRRLQPPGGSQEAAQQAPGASRMSVAPFTNSTVMLKSPWPPNCRTNSRLHSSLESWEMQKARNPIRSYENRL